VAGYTIGNPAMRISRMHLKLSEISSAAFLGMLLSCGPAYSESIPLIRDQGTLQVPVAINGVSLNFTIDSGATDVCIPGNVFAALLRTGTVLPRDLLDKRVYRLANGSEEVSQRFRIRSLRVGSLELRDVIASVVPSAGSLLLGQSFLSRLRSWSIDNERQVLLLTPAATAQAPLIATQVKNLKGRSDWMRLSAMNDPEGALFVNTASFQGNGNFRSLWEKHIFPPHTEKWLGKWVNYAVDHWAFDCGEQKARMDARTDYYEDGSHWVAEPKLISSTAWHRVQPDTWKDGEMKLLCEWQPARQF
jgi:clan AA aspartic protease (TIGR02281 family)